MPLSLVPRGELDFEQGELDFFLPLRCSQGYEIRGAGHLLEAVGVPGGSFVFLSTVAGHCAVRSAVKSDYPIVLPV